MNFLFDPGLNHFLQSFRNPPLTVFMLAISLFGSQQFLMLAAGFLFFKYGFKRTFIFVQMLFWSFILTNFLKELLQFPRPIRLDPSILTFNEYLPEWLIESVADNPGFPSGHVCSTVVFWGAVLISFGGKFQKLFGITLMILMPLSRMYLGRHLLGDVLGGFLLGLMILLVGFAPLIRSQRENLPPPKFLFAGYLLLPVVLNFIYFFPSTDLGQLFGFNAAIFCCLYFFKPPSVGLTQFMIAVLIFVCLNVALSNLQILPNRWIHFFISVLPMCFTIFIAGFFNWVGNKDN